MPTQQQFPKRPSHAEQIGSSLRNGWLVVLIVVGFSALGMLGYSMSERTPVVAKTKLVCPAGMIMVMMVTPEAPRDRAKVCILGLEPREVPNQ